MRNLPAFLLATFLLTIFPVASTVVQGTPAALFHGRIGASLRPVLQVRVTTLPLYGHSPAYLESANSSNVMARLVS